MIYRFFFTVLFDNILRKFNFIEILKLNVPTGSGSVLLLKSGSRSWSDVFRKPDPSKTPRSDKIRNHTPAWKNDKASQHERFQVQYRQTIYFYFYFTDNNFFVPLKFSSKYTKKNYVTERLEYSSMLKGWRTFFIKFWHTTVLDCIKGLR